MGTVAYLVTIVALIFARTVTTSRCRRELRGENALLSCGDGHAISSTTRSLRNLDLSTLGQAGQIGSYGGKSGAYVDGGSGVGGHGVGGSGSGGYGDGGSGAGAYGQGPAPASVTPQSRIEPSDAPSPIPASRHAEIARAPTTNACDECLGIFEQCGGGDKIPSSCCRQGLICTKKNAYYAECLPHHRIARKVNAGWDGSSVACGVTEGLRPGDTSRVRDERDT
jgi:hypothetical protein